MLTCHECKRELGAGDTAYRFQVINPPRAKGWGWGVSCVYLCADCVQPDRDRIRNWLRYQTCPGCGVKVGWTTKIPLLKDEYCSWRCKRVHKAKQKREALRCLECGAPVKASRADGRYCSNRCRQKAYRKRKA